MIQITKKEAAHLRATVPNVHITRTTHKRYAEETLAVLKALPDNLDAQASLRDLERSQNQSSYQY